MAFDHPTATAGGSRVFAIGSHNEYELLRIDPKTLTKTAMLAESGATDMDFSLDGQWVIYAARENGTLWKSRIDGSNRMQLMAGATGAFAPHWSPDQKQILFTGFLLDKQPRLYVVSAQGGSPKTELPMATREPERVTRFGDLLSSGAARCIFTGLSPDGSVYVTVDHGDVDVYAIDLKLR